MTCLTLVQTICILLESSFFTFLIKITWTTAFPIKYWTINTRPFTHTASKQTTIPICSLFISSFYIVQGYKIEKESVKCFCYFLETVVAESTGNHYVNIQDIMVVSSGLTLRLLVYEPVCFTGSSYVIKVNPISTIHVTPLYF